MIFRMQSRCLSGSGLSAEPISRKRKRQCRELWEQVPAEADGRTVQELDRLRYRMEAVGRPVVKQSMYQQVLRIAAILLLPLIGAASAWFVMQGEPKVIEPEWTECFCAERREKANYFIGRFCGMAEFRIATGICRKV